MSSLMSWAGNLLDTADQRTAGVLQKGEHDESEDLIGDADSLASSAPGSNDSHVTVEGLTKVWNETRDELARVKSLLRGREDAHRGTIQTLQQRLDDQIDANSRSRDERIEFLEEQLAEGARQRDSLQSQVDILLDQQRAIREVQMALVKERDDLHLEIVRMASEHTSHVQELRAERDQHELELLEHRQATSGSLQTLRDQESTLLADREKVSSALIQSDREQQRMASLLRHAHDEKSDVASQLRQVQEELDESSRQREVAIESERLARAELATISDEHARHDEAQRESFRTQQLELQEQIRKLSAQIAGSHGPASATTLEALHKKVESLTKHLLQRQSEIERIGGVSATLGRQLESERAKRSGLEADQRVLQGRLAELTSREGFDLESDFVRRRQLRIRQHRLFGKVMQVFDAAGTSLTVWMRRSPTTRIAVVVYILVLHVWVMIVLNHFVQHQSRDLSGRDAEPFK